MPRRRPESPDWSVIRAAHAAGVSVAALARRHRLAPSTIYRRAKREGWRRADDRESSPERGVPGHDVPGQDVPGRDDREARRAESGSPARRLVSPAGELAKLRVLAARLRERLETMIEGGRENGLVLGARESPASLLLKLCQISEKIIAVERRLAGQGAATPAELNDEDRAILARFKRRYGVD